jgi:hypothetical protein
MSINDEYFDKLIERIENAADCSEVQEIIDDIEEFIGGQITGCLDIISKLEGLITPPGVNLTAIVEWITNLIGVISGPYNKAIELHADIISKYMEIQSALDEKSISLNCNITLPSPPNPLP